MSAASKVLIVAGVLNLAAAFVVGFILSVQRLKEPDRPGGYLLQSHRVMLWESFMLLGLAYGVTLARLPSGWKLAGAILLVASAFFQDLSSVLNWLQDVRDEFAQRSLGFYMAVINAVLATAGLVILGVGIWLGL
jgi:hypothetical protein